MPSPAAAAARPLRAVPRAAASTGRRPRWPLSGRSPTCCCCPAARRTRPPTAPRPRSCGDAGVGIGASQPGRARLGAGQRQGAGPRSTRGGVAALGWGRGSTRGRGPTRLGAGQHERGRGLARLGAGLWRAVWEAGPPWTVLGTVQWAERGGEWGRSQGAEVRAGGSCGG